MLWVPSLKSDASRTHGCGSGRQEAVLLWNSGNCFQVKLKTIDMFCTQSGSVSDPAGRISSRCISLLFEPLGEQCKT